MLEKSSRASPLEKILPTPMSLGLSCNLQIEPTWAPCQCWRRCRWTKLFGWHATHCLKLHGLARAEKQTNVHACFECASNEILYMFCSTFEPFILPRGYLILCLFSLVMLLWTV